LKGRHEFPGSDSIERWLALFARVSGGLRTVPLAVSGLARLRGTAASLPDLEPALDANRDQAIDVLTIRAVFGGNDFATPVIVDDDHDERKLLHLRSQSPLSVASTTTPDRRRPDHVPQGAHRRRL
jgi:hypothetical protein